MILFFPWLSLFWLFILLIIDLSLLHSLFTPLKHLNLNVKRLSSFLVIITSFHSKTDKALLVSHYYIDRLLFKIECYCCFKIDHFILVWFSFSLPRVNLILLILTGFVPQLDLTFVRLPFQKVAFQISILLTKTFILDLIVLIFLLFHIDNSFVVFIWYYSLC